MKAWLKELGRRMMARPRGERLVLVALVLLGLGLAIYLEEHADTWPGAVAERLEEGKKPTAKHHFRTGMWYGTLCTVVVCIVAAATTRWWMRPLGGSGSGWRGGFAGSEPEVRRLFAALTLLAVAFGFWMRWPRMDESVYVDEEYTLRSYARGTFELDARRRPQFEPVEEAHRLWENTIGNNHFLYSVAGRWSLGVWKAMGERGEAAFSETAFRLPALVFGLGSIAMLAMLLYRLGYAHAGWLSAWLLALHPWHLRYSTEGRGYTMMLFFLLAGMYFLVSALRRGGWGSWVGYGVAQALMLASYGGALYVAAAQNLAALGYLVLAGRGRGGYPALGQGVRWMVANVLTATIVIQAMMPWVLEIRTYLLENRRAFGDMGPGWYLDVWSYLSAGMLWSSDDPFNPLHVTVRRLATDGWPMEVLVFGVVPLLVAAGWLRLLWGVDGEARWVGGEARVFACATVLAPLLALLHTRLGGQYLYVWYMLFVLPGVVGCMALAVQGGAGWLEGRTAGAGCRGSLRRRLFPLVAGGLAVVGFACMTLPQSSVLRVTPKEDFKRVVRLMRGETDVEGVRAPRTITAFSFSEGSFYDPWAVSIWNAGEVRDLMRMADATGRPLRISYGHRELSLQRRAEIMELLDDPRLFRLVGKVPGLEEAQFTHYVLEYIPGRFPAKDAPGQNSP